MDDALASVALDLSGRPYAVLDLAFRGERVGALSTQLVEHILESLARTLGANLHVQRVRPQRPPHRGGGVQGARAVAARGRGRRSAARRHRVHQGHPGMTAGALAIVDYGAGNLVSIRNALELLGGEPVIALDAGRRSRRHASSWCPASVPADRPWSACTARAWRTPSGGAVRDGAWYVGICLGLQLLFERSDEDDARMLGLLAGRRGGHRRRAAPAAHRLEPAGDAPSPSPARGRAGRRAGLLRALLRRPARGPSRSWSPRPSTARASRASSRPAGSSATSSTRNAPAMTACGCCATCSPSPGLVPRRPSEPADRCCCGVSSPASTSRTAAWSRASASSTSPTRATRRRSPPGTPPTARTRSCSWTSPPHPRRAARCWTWWSGRRSGCSSRSPWVAACARRTRCATCSGRAPTRWP